MQKEYGPQDVAQLGGALASGVRGQGFESLHPDHILFLFYNCDRQR